MNLRLGLRSRIELFKGSSEWDEIRLTREFPASEVALLICDMWDRHWCKTSTQRFDAIAREMANVVESARAKGVQIIHSPSDCMGFYEDTQQRKRMQQIPKIYPPEPLEITEPSLPVDASDGGCEDSPQCERFGAWTRQNPEIPIAVDDGISDDGGEVYSLLKQQGIEVLIIMGVAANMCILGRSFGIRGMTGWGIQCVLVRDLTDTMYNPRMPPCVTHDKGTELVVQHIEKYWCPSILGADLIG